MRVILPGDGVTRYDRDCYCFECASGKKVCRRCSYPVFSGDSDYCVDCPPRVWCSVCRNDCSERYFPDGESIARCVACCTCQGCGAIGQDVLEGKCTGCRGGVLENLQDALTLYPTAYEFLREIIGLTILNIPELRVSREPPEVQARRYPGGHYEGFIPAGICCSSGWIWLKSHMAEHISLFILVHELTHAWQNENVLAGQPGEVREGLAVWLEYKCAVHLNYPEFAQQIKNNRCPIYGGGLRTFLIWEEAVGWRQILQDVCIAHDFPQWLKLGWYRSQIS